nr:MAG TPA: hypothetical protein [Bacteriophage sp.]
MMSWNMQTDPHSQQPEKRGKSILPSMMIANGDGLEQIIKRWYQVRDLLMQSLREARIYTLLLKEQRRR